MACVRNCHHSRLASRVRQNSPRTRLLASNRMMLTRGAVGSFPDPRQRSHPRLAKRPACPQRKNSGTSLAFAIGPTAVEEKRKPTAVPARNQTTYQGPLKVLVAVHKNTNLVSQFSWEKTQAPPFLQVISLQRGPSAQHGVPPLGTQATDILVKLRTPGNRATRSKKLHLTKAELLLIQSASNPGGTTSTIL